MNMEYNVNKILIVGNGFDINIGLNEFSVNELNDLIFLKKDEQREEVINIFKNSVIETINLPENNYLFDIKRCNN
ncbi:hypothetical protein [Mesoplasma tabanidae]|uniref:Uncharacterized protein n=1 Tax=Mesoplasma tabanidae TaxID=219745 RepID=A0A2K8P5U3_9MOLU|nr:hypothetical protein [Mesoplasma tabanidae]ATZ21510.1 hypothetical protein MTABA_v1c03070 [Mesoplasma tabanidae]